MSISGSVDFQTDGDDEQNQSSLEQLCHVALNDSQNRSSTNVIASENTANYVMFLSSAPPPPRVIESDGRSSTIENARQLLLNRVQGNYGNGVTFVKSVKSETGSAGVNEVDNLHVLI